MTWSAPSARAFSAFSSLPTVVMTVAPIAFAMRIAAVPMPEPPAWIRTVSPSSSFALSNSMCWTVPKVMEAQAASVMVTSSGTGTHRRALVTIRSRANPSRWKPWMPPTFSQRLSRPSRQALHSPQVWAP